MNSPTILVFLKESYKGLPEDLIFELIDVPFIPQKGDTICTLLDTEEAPKWIGRCSKERWAIINQIGFEVVERHLDMNENGMYVELYVKVWD
jgi:hypothetical protein